MSRSKFFSTESLLDSTRNWRTEPFDARRFVFRTLAQHKLIEEVDAKGGVDVHVDVNGKEFDIEFFVEMLTAQYDEEVKLMARAMIKERLEKLSTCLQNVEEAVLGAFEREFGVIDGDEEY